MKLKTLNEREWNAQPPFKNNKKKRKTKIKSFNFAFKQLKIKN